MTGYKSKRAMAQDKVTDIDGHVVRDVRKTMKAALDKVLYNDWEQHTAPQQRPWVGLTDEEVMVAAYQAGFDIHEDYDNEDDLEAMHCWTPDGEVCDDSLLKLRDLIEVKLKEKNT